MNIFIDLDNTLCKTNGNNYMNSTPIYDRIEKVNQLKKDGNTIHIWTARGQNSGINYTELTKKQLSKWNINYDHLITNKPSYDLYIDDKSVNVDKYWKSPTNDISKKTKNKIVHKGWGKEIWFINCDEYCGKILQFNKNKKCSMHYHVNKKETWYVSKGKFIFSWITPVDGILHSEFLQVGDSITNERGHSHQLEALEDSEIFEVSTFHKDEDSYRVEKGD